MKKGLFAICICLLMSLSVNGQEIKTIFMNMPDSLCPMLSANNRADFFDFMASKMKAEVKNGFEMNSVMTDLSKDYFSLQIAKKSIWQVKLLAVSDTTKIICLIRTVYGPVADSSIDFYTTKWKSLSAGEYVTPPVMNDFFNTPASKNDTDSLYSNYLSIRRAANMLFMRASLTKSDNTLTFTFTTPDFLGKEMADKMKPFLTKPILYVWQNGKFERY